MEKQIIYLLIDSDSEPICAYFDKQVAINEAKESGCDVEELTVYK